MRQSNDNHVLPPLVRCNVDKTGTKATNPNPEGRWKIYFKNEYDNFKTYKK